MRRGISALVLILISTAALAAGCGRGAAPAPLAGRPVKVTTTTGMIADLAANIGAERVDVAGLMGPGVDPHLYKPSASDVEKLEGADIILYNGLELEGRMTDVFVKIARGGKPTVAVSEDIDPETLREPVEFQGKYDPHIWFDVTLWRQAARTVARELAKLDPTSKSLYERNADAYVTRLDELHRYVQEQIATIPPGSRVLVTAHDAFGYFGRRYGMEVRGLQGTSTATEAGARDVSTLAQYLCERRIKAIFVESSVPHSTIRAVQEAARARRCSVAIGGELFSDAMGSRGTPEGTYIGMVRHNVDTIARALR
jgi:manganese/zinc/iron transport system substrate-binding protein